MSRTNTYLRELPPGLTHIDVYWVLRLFNVTDPCAQHAVKKLLADGSGDKDRATNIREAWETLDRWREMEREGPFDDERQEQVRERHEYQPPVTFDDYCQMAIDAEVRRVDEERQKAQRPPDRHSASHCPDGGACRHKCGLEPCKGQS